MPKPDYRIPSRRERELSNQVGDLRERLGALSKDPSAELEIRHLEGLVAERDSAIAALQSDLESERARAARLRGELAGSGAKRKELESQVKQLKRDVGNERARTKSAQSNFERMSGSHARLLEETRALRARNSELEDELARKDALIEHLNARLSRGPENLSLPPSSEPNRKLSRSCFWCHPQSSHPHGDRRRRRWARGIRIGQKHRRPYGTTARRGISALRFLLPMASIQYMPRLRDRGYVYSETRTRPVGADVLTFDWAS